MGSFWEWKGVLLIIMPELRKSIRTTLVKLGSTVTLPMKHRCRGDREPGVGSRKCWLDWHGRGRLAFSRHGRCFGLTVPLVVHWKYLTCCSLDSGKCISVLAGALRIPSFRIRALRSLIFFCWDLLTPPGGLHGQDLRQLHLSSLHWRPTSAPLGTLTVLCLHKLWG